MSADSGAIVSACSQYRYLLWRTWGDGGRALFLMLNPSTADASDDDPTIRKCVGFARRWGLGGIRVVNLFAWRATDPRGLIAAESPVGPENDAHLRAELAASGGVVCAWGSTGGAQVKRLVDRRLVDVRRILAEVGVHPLCLGRAKDGSPRHPLMLAYDTPLVVLAA